jgi:hypothetical protein
VKKLTALAEERNARISQLEEANTALRRRIETADRQVDDRNIAISLLNIRVETHAKTIALLRETVAHLRAESWMTADFVKDLQLITVAGAHLLCGSFWIRGEALLEAIRRYTERG